MNDNDFFDQDQSSQESAPTLKIKTASPSLTIKSPATTDAPSLTIKKSADETPSLSIKSPAPSDQNPGLTIKKPSANEPSSTLTIKSPNENSQTADFYNDFNDQNEYESTNDFNDDFYHSSDPASDEDSFENSDTNSLKINQDVHVDTDQPELFSFEDNPRNDVHSLDASLDIHLNNEYESQNDVDSFLPKAELIDHSSLDEQIETSQSSIPDTTNTTEPTEENIIDPPIKEEPIIKSILKTPLANDLEDLDDSWRNKTLRSSEEMPPPSNSESMKKLKEMDLNASDHSPKTILLLDKPLPEDGQLEELTELDQNNELETPQKPSNSGAMKIIQEDPKQPSPGEHAPQTIIVLNKPLPNEVKSPEHVSDIDLHEEVLNTAAQENVFEHLGDTEPQYQSQHLFNAEEISDEKPTHLQNSPTLYEMEDDMTLGQVLLHARENASLTIKELSRKTNIKEMHIISLEDENRSKLPDPIYTKSYIKTLCNELNIPYEKLLDLYAQLMGAEFDTQYNIAQKGPDKFASKPASSAIQKWSAIVAIFVIIGLAAAGFAIQNFYTPVPVLKDGDVIDLNDFHPSVTVPIPRLEIPKN